MTRSRLLEKVYLSRSQYRILGQVGQGQFGRVFCAVHRQTGKLFALKDLDQRLPTPRFLREISYLVSLRHPNVVAFHALEHHPTGRYLVMDYCEGGTLRDLIESAGQLSVIYSLKLIADILAGLAHAHSRRIVHCDLKPENILLTLSPTGWTAKISDFGIARFNRTLENLNWGRGYTGSPAYMAPERFYGKYSYASDLYAVGILLFELIVGERPFSGVPGELMLAHLNQRVMIPETVPASVGSIIETALQKLPQRRFACAEEMRQSLRLAARGLVTKDSSPCLFLPPSSTVAKNSLAILRQESLVAPVTHLAVADQAVYLGLGGQLRCQVYADDRLADDPVQQWQSNLDASLVALVSSPHGCFALTKASFDLSTNYCLYAFPQRLTLIQEILTNCWGTEANSRLALKPFALLSLSATKLVSAFESQGRWLALATQSETTLPLATFQILKLPSLQGSQPSVYSALPSQLIALDSDHGLAVFPCESVHSKPSTAFYLFNRRGSFFSAFSLPLALHKIVTSATSLIICLPLEGSDRATGVLIELQPFKVSRTALSIIPDFVVAYTEGYLLANRQGQVVLLDRAGRCQGRLEIADKITAIAASHSRLLLASWSGQMGKLYMIE